MPYPYAEARLLHVAGQLHARRGELEDARARLEEAQAIFARLGACADVARTQQALTTLTRMADAPRAAALTGGALMSGEQDGAAGRPIGRRLSRSDRHAWALARLRTNGALSPRLYATVLGVSLDTALRDLSALAQQGRVVAASTTSDRRYDLRHPAG